MDERRQLADSVRPASREAALTSLDVMDREAVRAVLANLAPRRRTSRLDGYVDLIRALRRRGRSYREIVAVLRARCGVRVGLHTLHPFVRTRVRTAPHASAPRRASPPARSSATVDAVAGPVAAGDEAAVRARIAALRQRAAASPAVPNKEFHYDENEPLQLAADRGPHKR
jgi:hypothetical protein